MKSGRLKIFIFPLVMCFSVFESVLADEIKLMPVESLVNKIKVDLKESGMNREFYEFDHLNEFFEGNYNLKYDVHDRNEIFVSIDHIGLNYVNLTSLKKVWPCFNYGKISYKKDGKTKKIKVIMDFVTNVNADWIGVNKITADLIVKEFGEKYVIRPGYIMKAFSSRPAYEPDVSMHHDIFSLGKKNHDSGNIWMDYIEESKFAKKEFHFRTSGNGGVEEIIIYMERK